MTTSLEVMSFSDLYGAERLENLATLFIFWEPLSSQWGPAFTSRPGNTWIWMLQVCYPVACGNCVAHLEYTCINYVFGSPVCIVGLLLF